MSDKKTNKRKLRKNITNAFLPYLDLADSNEVSNNLTDAQYYLLDSAKSQLNLLIFITENFKNRQEIQIEAGALRGFFDNLINQLTAMVVINDRLSDQIIALTEKCEEIKGKHKLGGGAKSCT